MLKNKNQEELATNKKINNKALIIKILNFVYLYKYYFLALECLIILTAGYFFVISSQIKLVFDRKQQTEIAEKEIQQKIASYDMEINKLNELLKIYKLIKPGDKDAIKKMLPTEPQFKELFQQIEALVKANGLVLETITIDQTELKKQQKSANTRTDPAAKGSSNVSDIGEIPISISVSGVTYNALKSLLNSLEHNTRIIDVVSIVFTPDSSAELKMKAYYQKVPTQKSSVDIDLEIKL